MTFVTKPAPFRRSKMTTEHKMLILLGALLVLLGAGLFFQFSVNSQLGVQVLLVTLVSLLTTLAADVVMALIVGRRKVAEIVDYVRHNYSYITALIMVLIVPVYVHLYVIFIGALFATVVGKLVFGGFGKNVANPAIVGRILIAVCFGSNIADPSLFDTFLGSTVTGYATSGTVTTAWVQATSWLQSSLQLGEHTSLSIQQLLVGNYQGAIGETFTILIAVLGVALVALKVIDWRQPVFFLGTVAVAALIIAGVSQNNAENYIIDNPLNYMLLHLGLGGLMFGAVFMLTDPVTTPTSPMGKIITAIIAGFLTVLIRVKSGSVEGVMYAILFVNILTPLVDAMIKGRTTKNVTNKLIGLGAFASVGLLLVGLAGIRPGLGRPEGVAYVGTSSTLISSHDDDMAVVEVTIYINKDLLDRVLVSYHEVNAAGEDVYRDTFRGSITSGEFYDTYVTDTALRGKSVSELQEMFQAINGRTLVAALPGVTGSTVTAFTYVKAFLNALSKVGQEASV